MLLPYAVSRGQVLLSGALGGIGGKKRHVGISKRRWSGWADSGAAMLGPKELQQQPGCPPTPNLLSSKFYFVLKSLEKISNDSEHTLE